MVIRFVSVGLGSSLNLTWAGVLQQRFWEFEPSPDITVTMDCFTSSHPVTGRILRTTPLALHLV